jgi:uncharacterized protein YcfJ
MIGEAMTYKNFSDGSLGCRAATLALPISTLKVAALVAGLSVFSTSAYADSSYERARVVSSIPVYQTVVYEDPREVCRHERVAHQESAQRSKTPVIIGALVGGALGNAIGHKKSNKRVGTVVGGILGYSIAKDIGRHKREHDANQRVTFRQQEFCNVYYDERKEQELLGYDVSYVYAGQTYNTRLDQDPGESLRVRVAVDPA